MKLGITHQYAANAPGAVLVAVQRRQRSEHSGLVLHAGVAVDRRPILAVVEDSGQSRMHRVYVVTAVEIIVDVHLPIAIQDVFVRAAELEIFQSPALHPFGQRR